MGSKALTSQPASPSLRGPESVLNSIPQNMQQDLGHSDHYDLTSKLHKDSLPVPSTVVYRELTMCVLGNEKLLHMLQAWQAVISSGQEAYARADTGFQDVMTELEERRLIDGNWRWTVNDDQIDKAYVRLVLRPEAVHSTRSVPPGSDPTITGRMASKR